MDLGPNHHFCDICRTVCFHIWHPFLAILEGLKVSQIKANDNSLSSWENETQQRGLVHSQHLGSNSELFLGTSPGPRYPTVVILQLCCQSPWWWSGNQRQWLLSWEICWQICSNAHANLNICRRRYHQHIARGVKFSQRHCRQRRQLSQRNRTHCRACLSEQKNACSRHHFPGAQGHSGLETNLSKWGFFCYILTGQTWKSLQTWKTRWQLCQTGFEHQPCRGVPPTGADAQKRSALSFGINDWLTLPIFVNEYVRNSTKNVEHGPFQSLLFRWRNLGTTSS